TPSSSIAGSQQQGGKKRINGPPPQPTLPAVRHAILELFARLPPQRCPHCRKWICNERRPGKICHSSARLSRANAFFNSSRNQEQPRPGTAGGALVSKLPSWRRSALSIADVGFWGRSGNLVLYPGDHS